jgi:hypothetical protein
MAKPYERDPQGGSQEFRLYSPKNEPKMMPAYSFCSSGDISWMMLWMVIPQLNPGRNLNPPEEDLSGQRHTGHQVVMSVDAGMNLSVP